MPRPPVARGVVVKDVDAAGLRIVRFAYAMHYSLGTRAHVICTRELFARLVGLRDAHKATARTLLRALEKSLRRAPTPCDNRIQRESFRASSAPTIDLDLWLFQTKARRGGTDGLM